MRMRVHYLFPARQWDLGAGCCSDPQVLGPFCRLDL